MVNSYEVDVYVVPVGCKADRENNEETENIK